MVHAVVVVVVVVVVEARRRHGLRAPLENSTDHQRFKLLNNCHSQQVLSRYSLTSSQASLLACLLCGLLLMMMMLMMAAWGVYIAGNIISILSIINLSSLYPLLSHTVTLFLFLSCSPSRLMPN
uniref:Uncharacterized protein n=1 Tax=Anopheles braziliensis TaxID=58242 RepID=A0A2M3ZLY2_9DIPT